MLSSQQTRAKHKNLIEAYKNSHLELLQYCEKIDHTKFFASNLNVWNPAEHLGHLWVVQQKVSLFFVVPGFFLRFKYGAMNRAERSPNELKSRYSEKLELIKEKHPNAYAQNPYTFTVNNRKQTIKDFRASVDKLTRKLNKKSPIKMARTLAPHPAMGKLNLNEWVKFTTLHTQGHLESIKKLTNN